MIKSIYIDPGHRNNINDFGACGNDLKESERALKIADILARELRKYGVRVFVSRDSENTPKSLKARTDEANRNNVDLYLSIHINAHDNKGATGVEVLYNVEQELATKMSQRMSQYTDMVNRGPKYRDDLHVLNQSKMPAVLVECGFISNPSDAAKLKDPLILEQFALAMLDTLEIGQYKDEYTDAIQKLVIEGIVGSPAAWLPNPNPTNVNALIAKYGRKKWGLHCHADTIDRMADEGIILNPEVWHQGTEKLDNIKKLVVKIALNI